MGKRRRAREMALQMLYQHEIGGRPPLEIFGAFDIDDFLSGSNPASGGRDRIEESFEYAKTLVQGTLDSADEVDALIREHAENWRLERMPSIDRNILRLALYEMLHESNVPKVVIVDEAIELAKKYGSENSGRFVNGLLDGVLKSKALKDRQ